MYPYPKNAKLMSEEELLAFYARCLEDYHFFAWNVLGYTDMNEHHKALCDFLQSTGKKFKLILMPRYTFKSCVITQGFGLWKLVRNPNERIMIYSDAHNKAQGFLTGIKNHIEGKVGTSRFREFYPGWEVNPHKDKWNESQINISKRTHASVEPNVDTGGIETSKVGYHYDTVYFDDIVSDLNVTTKAQMDKVHDCYKKALSLLKPGGEVIMCGTRWHFNDAYGRIIKENEVKQVFDIFIRQAIVGDKYLFDNIGESSLTKEFLEQQKAEQGTYHFSCNPYEAPIIMGDLTAKPIGEVKEGESVVGFRKRGTQRKEYNRYELVKSRVLKVQSREAEVVKITLESGRQIRCTPDHHWWTMRRDGTHREYKPAAIGGRLMWVMEPYIEEPDQYQNDLAKWLGGMYDGEGDCTGSIVINQSHHTNKDICDRLAFVLDELGFEWNVAERPPTSTAWGKSTNCYWINGGPEGKRKFIQWCSPVKAYEIEQSVYSKGCHFVRERDKVVSIEPDGREKVFALQTETGNYIAWGYASKNCLYQNSPVSDDEAIFKAQDFSFYGELARSSNTQQTGLYDNLYITGTLDPAGEGEDCTGGSVVGTDAALRMHVLELFNRSGCNTSEMVEWILKMNRKYHFRKFGIETTFYRGMLKRELEERLQEERLQHPEVNSFAVEQLQTRWRKGEGKQMRIFSLQPFHERGDLLFPGESVEGLKGLFGDLAYQMMQFTPTHMPEPNDLIDALSWQVEMVQRGGMPKKAGPPKRSPAWLEEQWIADFNTMQKRLPARYRRTYQSSLS